MAMLLGNLHFDPPPPPFPFVDVVSLENHEVFNVTG